jgi:hypothetical protein
LKFPPIHGSFDVEAFMFENARHEAGRLDDLADLRSYAEVQTARRHFGPQGYPFRLAVSAKEPPLLLDTPAIRITSNSLKTKDYGLV